MIGKSDNTDHLLPTVDTVDAFLNQVSEAPYLIHLGGPYPNNEQLQIICDRDNAFCQIADMLTDVVPHALLDSELADALNHAKSILSLQSSFIRRLLPWGGHRLRRSRMHSLSRSIGHAAKTWKLAPAHAAIAEDHLEEVLKTHLLLLEAGLIDQYPLLHLAGRCTFYGLLVVDIVNGSNRKLLVH